jgi:hypothetical protein
MQVHRSKIILLFPEPGNRDYIPRSTAQFTNHHYNGWDASRESPVYVGQRIWCRISFGSGLEFQRVSKK